MKIIASLSLYAVLALGAAAPAQTGPARSTPRSARESQAREQLQRIYAEYEQILFTNNARAFHNFNNRYLASSFRHVPIKGKAFTRQQIDAEVRAALKKSPDIFPNASIIENASTIKQLSLHGNRAVALIDEKHTMVTKADLRSFRPTFPAPDGKDHTIHIHRLTSETWVHTPSGWKLSHVRDLSERVGRDGKTILKLSARR